MKKLLKFLGERKFNRLDTVFIMIAGYLVGTQKPLLGIGLIIVGMIISSVVEVTSE